MSTPKIDGLRAAYYNAETGQYRNTAPGGPTVEEWEPVLILSANGGLDAVTLTADVAAWLLPDFAKLIADYTGFMDRQTKENQS